MNKGKKYYIIIWALLVALFNFICFVTLSEINGVSKYTPTFWSSYGFIMAAFVIHLIFNLCIKSNIQEKKAFNTSLSLISWIELVLMVAVGAVVIIVPNIPYWVGSIICAVILVFSIVFVLSTKTASEPVMKANQELNAKTASMRLMTDEAEALLKKTNNDEELKLVKDVYEAFRYSDPTSNNELQADEDEIYGKLNEFAKCVSDKRGSVELKKSADELISLIENRNRKCKALKRRA